MEDVIHFVVFHRSDRIIKSHKIAWRFRAKFGSAGNSRKWVPFLSEPEVENVGHLRFSDF